MTATDWMRGVLAWLATYGVHSTLFLGSAWLVCRVRPPRSDANRERLWKLALVGGVLSASAQLALGARPLLGRLEWDAGRTVARAEPAAPQAEAAPATAEDPVAIRMPRHPATPAARRQDATEPERPVAAAAPAASEPVRTVPILARPTTEPPIARGDAPGRTPPLARTREPRPGGTGTSGATEPSRARTPSPAPAASTSSASPMPEAAAVAARWPGLVLGGWIAIGLAGLAALAASWTALRRRMLDRRSLSSGPLFETLERVRARAGLRRPVRLSVSTRVASPFSLGLFRPEVCVPAAVLTGLAPAQQEALLAHEVAHLVRRDPLWFAASTVIERLFFFQPLNRVARRQLAELAEVACDDWAVRWTGARLALASCLAEVAGWMIGEPRRLALPGLGGQRSRLGTRITRLLDGSGARAASVPARLWTPGAAGGLALAVLAVPGVAAGRPAPAAEPLEPAPEERASPAVVPLLGPVSWGDVGASELAAATRRAEALQRMGELAARSAAAATDVLASERAVLEEELALLEDELSELRDELVARRLDDRFAGALARIDARMDELRVQHARVRALLARLALPSTPPAGFTPADGAPAPVHDSFPDQGVPR